MSSIHKFNVYELVDTPANKKHIDIKRVFMAKEDESSNVVKFKARWMVKGFM